MYFATNFLRKNKKIKILKLINTYMEINAKLSQSLSDK